MLRRVSIAILGLAVIGGPANAQALGGLLGSGLRLPAAPPASVSNPVQEGLALGVGPTAQGNLAVGLHSGQQLPVPIVATVSPDGTTPKGGPSVYLRVPKDANGAAQGLDVRLGLLKQNGTPIIYQGVQLGQQGVQLSQR